MNQRRGADGHHSQHAQAVQGEDGHGLNVIYRKAAFLADQFADLKAIMSYARNLFPVGASLLNLLRLRRKSDGVVGLQASPRHLL